MARSETPDSRLDTSPLPTLVRASLAPICIDVKIVEREHDDATTIVRTIDPPRRGVLELIAAAALLVLVGSTAAGFEAARAHASAPAVDVAHAPRAATVSGAREATILRSATAPEKTVFEDTVVVVETPPAQRRAKTASSPKPKPRYPWLDR